MNKFNIILCICLAIIFNSVRAQFNNGKFVCIEAKNMELLAFLELIGEKYDVGFLYNNDLFYEKKQIYIPKNVYSINEICELLEDILDVECSVIHNAIILKPAKPDYYPDKSSGIKLNDISINHIAADQINKESQNNHIELIEIQSINAIINKNNIDISSVNSSYHSSYIGEYINSFSKQNSKIGVGFFPLYSTYKNIRSNNLGIQAGVFYDYNINQRYELNTGCYFSSQYFKLDTLINDADSLSTTTISNEDKRKIIYFILPLNIRYNYLKNSKYNLYINISVLSYLFKNNLYNSTSVMNIESGLNLVGYLNLSTGIERRVFEKLSVQIEPGLRLPFYSNNNKFKSNKYYGVLCRLNYTL